jgi:hypothetical protein
LLPSRSSFWLGRWFLLTPRPIIVVVTIVITITIAKFSELARRPGHCAGSFFLARKVLLAVERFRGVNADRIY